MISFEDFKKLEIKTGRIIAIETIEGSDKLLKLTVDTGEERTIVAGIGREYSPEELADKTILVLCNLEPKELMGIESQGMLLAVDIDGRAVLVHPDKYCPPGSRVT